MGAGEKYQERLRQLQDNSAKTVKIAYLRKIELLLDEYGIARDDPERWLLLAFELARDFVPGFAIDNRKAAGRPPTWKNSLRLFYLWWDVQELRRKNNRLSVASACAALAKQPEWGKWSKSTLRRQYEAEAEASDFVTFATKVIDKLGWDETADAMRELLGDRDKNRSEIDTRRAKILVRKS